MKNLILLISLFYCLHEAFSFTGPFPICAPQSCQYELVQLSEFKKLSFEQNSSSGSKAIVKVVYYRNQQGGGQLYFINTKKQQYHYDFVKESLGSPFSLEQFNRNYEGDGQGRIFNLGTLTYLSSQEGETSDLFLLELWSGDELQGTFLKEFYQKVRENLKIDIPLYYHPLSVKQEKILEKGMQEVPFMTTDEIYKDQKHQLLSEGIAYGYIKIIDDNQKMEDLCLDQTHIPVFKKVPNDIGLVAGVITEEFQTPLSHINIKSLNRGTVNIALKEATQKLASFNHSPVQLEVTKDGYKITPLSELVLQEKMKQFWKERRPKNPLRPQSLLGSSQGKDFISLQNLFSPLARPRDQHKRLLSLMGAKATHLAWLHTFLGEKAEKELGVFVPRGYAIPFDFYEDFMNFSQKGLDEKNPQRVTTPLNRTLEIMQEGGLLEDNFHSLCQARPYLQSIRETLGKSAVPPRTLNLMKKYLLEEENSPIHQSKVAKIRLRSSTNAEDLEGFSGAGLYLSAGLTLYEEKDDVPLKSKPLTWAALEKKLKKKIPALYASVWNDRAFEEREWYWLSGRRHLDVKVGLLLHRAFPKYDWDMSEGEGGNGVALTKNIYNQFEFEKIYINAQHDDFPITNPPSEQELLASGEDPGEAYTTEQILVTPYSSDPLENQRRLSWKGWSYELLGRSSLRNGELVLLDDPLEKEKMSFMEIRRLARALQDLNHQFARLYQKDEGSFILDTEWKIYGRDRLIWIKQARPLTLGRH